MPHRLHITLLKDDEPTLPDQPGRSFTLALPNDLPEMAALHRHTVYVFNQAQLIIRMMEAAKTLFPCGTTLPAQHPLTDTESL